jgi:hypothetical protein
MTAVTIVAATVASIALPPRRSIDSPASVAKGKAETTIESAPETSGPRPGSRNRGSKGYSFWATESGGSKTPTITIKKSKHWTRRLRILMVPSPLSNRNNSFDLYHSAPPAATGSNFCFRQIRINKQDDAVLTETGMKYLSEPQTKLILIKSGAEKL